MYWGARALQGVREQFPALQPQDAPQMVVCSQEPQRLAELVWLQAEKRELRDEWVSAPASARQAKLASRRLEHSQVPARVAWERFSEPQAQRQEAALGELLEPPVWRPGQQAEPVPVASRERAPRELAAVPLPVRLASTALPSQQPPSLPSPL